MSPTFIVLPYSALTVSRSSCRRRTLRRSCSRSTGRDRSRSPRSRRRGRPRRRRSSRCDTSRSSSASRSAGSVTEGSMVSPSASITALAMPTARATSGSSATSAATAGLIPAPLKSSVTTTRSPPKSWSTVCSIVALIDAPNVVKRATTAVPTIRADALDAVRRGSRIALRRARRPVWPRSAWREQTEHGGRRTGDDRAEDDRADERRQRADARLHQRRCRRSSRVIVSGDTDRRDHDAADEPGPRRAGGVDGGVPQRSKRRDARRRARRG